MTVLFEVLGKSLTDLGGFHSLNIRGLVGALAFASVYAVGEGVLSGRTLASGARLRAGEPLTTLPRSARSRVSSSRSFERPARTPSPPRKAWQRHALRKLRLLRQLCRGCRASLGALPHAAKKARVDRVRVGRLRGKSDGGPRRRFAK